jgi:hypothetical protein
MMIYIFWLIYLGILAIAAIGLLIKGGYKTNAAKLDFVFSIITWIGLFGYVTNNQILTPLVWKFVFVGGLLWDVIFSFKKFNEESTSEEIPKSIRPLIIGITLIIFVGPLYFGLFNYAFK